MISIIEVSKEKYKPMSKRKDLIKEYAEEAQLSEDFIRSLFTIYVSHYILHQIRKSVKQQMVKGKKMKRVYKPLSKSYKKTKPWGTKTKFWINSGALIKKLGVYVDTDKRVHIGFRGNPTYLNNKSKVEFKKVLKYMEYGTKKMPPRPLIRPILKVTAKNITWLFFRFKRTVDIEQFKNLNGRI
jgi:hypothetical protein